MSTGFPSGAAGSSGPRLRIGDAEREHAVTLLSEHYAAGRITHQEFDERSTRAYAAKTNADLWPLFRDLPALRPVGVHPGSGATRAPVPARQPVPQGRRYRPGAGPVLVLLMLTALALLDGFSWVLVALVGWFLLSRAFGLTCGGHSKGSRREDRGSWS